MQFKTLSAMPIVWLLLPTTSISQETQQDVTVRVASISFEPVKFDLETNCQSLES